jgi:hypothetical protein
MSDALITVLTLEQLRDVMQLAGYRVETVTDPVVNSDYLRSATSGLAFDVRPGNRLAGNDGSFVDAALVAVLQVQGELPLDIVNRWNATRRFARLQLSAPFLVLTHDVSVAGGVGQNHLRAQVEIWDHLVQQLVGYLREELPKLNTGDRATAPAPAANDRTTAAAAGTERGIQPTTSTTVQ